MSDEKLGIQAQDVNVVDPKGDFTHLEKVNTNNGDWQALREDAMRAEETERSMGLMEGLRNYPNAVFWSFAISLCISEYSGLGPSYLVLSAACGMAWLVESAAWSAR